MAWAGGRLTPKQKKMAELIHQGKCVLHAYNEAGYAPSTWTPYVFKRNKKIIAYVRYLEERAMKKNDITVEKVLTDLESAKNLAMDGGQPSAAVNATMAQAKIVGLIVDRVEKKDVSEMDMKELAASIKEVFGDQGAPLIQALGLEEKEPEEWKDFPVTGTVQ
jgi:translation initiation factor 1 (eIF-1/SUI1)